MVWSSKTAYRGFTFAETLVAIALLVVSAGLATQLLFSSLTFTQRFEASQHRYQSLLSMKTGLLALAGRVRPPLWANPQASFVGEGNHFRVDYWDGIAGQSASLTSDNAGYVRWTDPQGEVSWGPWKGASVAFWSREGRVLGFLVTLTDRGTTVTLKFPWGSWPL